MDLKKLARLARVRLTEDEEQEFGPQLQAILAHVQAIEAVNVAGMEASAAAGGASPLREDEARPEGVVEGREGLVELSPGNMNGFFEVPQVVAQ